MQLIDVTVPLGPDLPVYPGNTPFSLQADQRMALGANSNVSSLHMSVHTGTHVDAPRHSFDDGASVEALALDLLIGPARVVEVYPATAIEPEDLIPLELSGETRVLIKTRNSEYWTSSEFRADYVGVSEAAAHYLIGRGVKLVGVDYLSVERFKTPGRPAHRILLGQGTIVVEGLNLKGVAPGHYELFCLPLPIPGADGAPARVLLGRRP
jgi:arylformamidase